MKSIVLIPAALILVLLALGSRGEVQAQTSGNAAYAGNIENGKRLFEVVGCWQCHNYNGSGGRAGARLSQTRMTAAGLVNYIRKPRQMPAYSVKVLPDREAMDIAAYIKAFPEPPPVKDIPLLNLD